MSRAIRMRLYVNECYTGKTTVYYIIFYNSAENKVVLLNHKKSLKIIWKSKKINKKKFDTYNIIIVYTNKITEVYKTAYSIVTLNSIIYNILYDLECWANDCKKLIRRIYYTLVISTL